MLRDHLSRHDLFEKLATTRGGQPSVENVEPEAVQVVRLDLTVEAQPRERFAATLPLVTASLTALQHRAR